jgi:hypothetical protein
MNSPRRPAEAILPGRAGVDQRGADHTRSSASDLWTFVAGARKEVITQASHERRMQAAFKYK